MALLVGVIESELYRRAAENYGNPQLMDEIKQSFDIARHCNLEPLYYLIDLINSSK